MKIITLIINRDFSLLYYDTKNNYFKYFEAEKYFKIKKYNVIFNSFKLYIRHKEENNFVDNLNNIVKIFLSLEQISTQKYMLIISKDSVSYTNWSSKILSFFKSNNINNKFVDIKIDINHQICHILPSIIINKLDNAIGVSIDGEGDGFASIYNYKNNHLELLKQIDFSYGYIYLKICEECLNKINIHKTSPEGTFMAYATLSNNYIKEIDYFINNYSELNSTGYKIDYNNTQFKKDLDNILNKYDIKDVAYTLQEQWINHVMKFIEPYKDINNNLVISGGCALNCILNYRLVKSGWFKNIYWTPVANDSGQSLGALYQYIFNYNKDNPDNSIEYPNIDNYHCTYDGFDLDYYKNKIYNKTEELDLDRIVDLLADEKIIALWKGKVEMGPRALGNRSILASPYKIETHDKLNNIKGREQFRPFGIIIPREYLSTYFDIDIDAPYMNVIGYNKLDIFKASTHSDNSTRIQTVTEKSDPLLYKLLMKFKEKTGHPILINTSFNTKGKPIFNWYEEAYQMYLNYLDAIIFNDRMIIK